MADGVIEMDFRDWLRLATQQRDLARCLPAGPLRQARLRMASAYEERALSLAAEIDTPAPPLDMSSGSNGA
jgi:hypothetical protein